MDRTQALAALSALAHGDRLDLVRLLVQTGPDGLPAGEIGRALGLPAPRLSFHLSQLDQAGLVTSRRVARNVIYAAQTQALGGMLAFLLRDCCAGHPEVMACYTARGGENPAPPAPGSPVSGSPVSGSPVSGSPDAALSSPES